ncbi:MAG TPA: glutamate-5-semialdehyde dehydrogenase [Acidimicrobiales bacterium]|nr:glutamate-5-semialdehyde dehydrogenase [Acidimicrobiales bacterium]
MSERPAGRESERGPSGPAEGRERGTLSAVPDLGRRAKAASRSLATASTAAKDAALLTAADLLVERSDDLLAANAGDIERQRATGAGATVVDRLRLTQARIDGMAGGLRQVAGLADPVGEITEGWVRPNGLRIHKVRVPLGVVAIIYENRPNVTSDAFGLCLKSGNAAFLRGSSGAIRSNVAIAGVLREALAKAGLPEDALVLVEDTSRDAAVEFMQQRDTVDCLIPRGGPSLIRSILDNATVPYVIDGDGNCHVYVDAHADLPMAADIVVNAKAQRPSVCNAAETLLVHEAVAAEFLPLAAARLDGVELVGDDASRGALGDHRVGAATEDDWAREFLALKLAVRVVPSLDGALDHIARYGSGHSEAIVTGDLEAAERFTREVDAAAVLVNASTRFVDGEEFGFGAEIGISTQKLHARGPMGLRELTTEKYVVHGDGQTRG